MTSADFKKSRKRNELIKELVSTEESYVQSLRLLMNNYFKVVKQNTALLSEKKAKVMFSNMEQILSINETVLTELQTALGKWPSKNELGETFSRMAPFLKAYVTYINNYGAAFDLFDKCEKKNNKFNRYCNEQIALYPTNPGFQSLLIQPVQRIPRYKM